MAGLLKQPQLARLYHCSVLYFTTLLSKRSQITSLVIVPLLRSSQSHAFNISTELGWEVRSSRLQRSFDLKSSLNRIIWKSLDGKIDQMSSEKLHTSQKVWQLICCWCFRIVRMEQIDASPWDAGAAAGAAAPAQNSLHLPLHFDRACLETQLKMIGDVISESLCRGVKDVFTSLTKLHPHRGYFQRGLIKLCLCLPSSQPIHPREYFFTLRSAFDNTVMHNNE